MKLLPVVLAAAACGATAPSAADAYAIFLGKAEARNQVKGYGRAVCDRLENCLDTSVEPASECSRISAIQVECDLTTIYSDFECVGAIRVTEKTRFYNRKGVYGVDCN